MRPGIVFTSRMNYLFLPWLVVLVVAPVIMPSTAHALPSRYLEGDWEAITSVRFVSSIALSQEYVYFGSNGGIARYDRFRNQWDGIWTTLDGLPSNEVTALAFDPETQELYARTPEGDAVYYSAGFEFEHTNDFPNHLVVRMTRMNLLNYSLPSGYSALHEGIITDAQLRDFPVVGAVSDSWGNLWVATWGLGVWKGSEYHSTLERIPYGLAHSNVRAIAQLGSTWWFGGPWVVDEPAGVSVYDTVTHDFSYVEARYTDGFSSDQILDFEQTGDTLWMATPSGVTRYDSNHEFSYLTYDAFSGLLSDMVTSVAADEDMLWIGTDLGPNVLLIPQDSVARATDRLTNGTYVYDLQVIDDFVWMGTDEGLFRLWKEEPEWRRFSQAESILDGHVRAIAADDTAYYFGTDLGLAVVWRDGSGIRELTIGDFSVDPDIYALAVIDRIVWASTPYGLLRYDVRKKQYRVFDREDGLFDDFVQSIYPDGDYLWLGTQQGVQRFFWNNPYRID